MLSSLPSQVDGEVAGIQVPIRFKNNGIPTQFMAPNSGLGWKRSMRNFPNQKKRGPNEMRRQLQEPPIPPTKCRKLGQNQLTSMFGPLLREKGKEPEETVLQRVSLLYLSNIDLVIQTGAIFVTNATVPPKKHQILPQVLCQPGYEYIRK
jgi:hypothetical protein